VAVLQPRTKRSVVTVLSLPLHSLNIAKGRTDGLRVFTLIERLERLSSEDEVMAALERILATFDIRYFMFLRDWPNSTEFEELVFCQRMPEQWFKLYVKEKYSGIDPAFWPRRLSSRRASSGRSIARSSPPVRWHRSRAFDEEMRRARSSRFKGSRWPAAAIRQ
jgi:Autoinducer binding domain